MAAEIRGENQQCSAAAAAQRVLVSGSNTFFLVWRRSERGTEKRGEPGRCRASPIRGLLQSETFRRLSPHPFRFISSSISISTLRCSAMLCSALRDNTVPAIHLSVLSKRTIQDHRGPGDVFPPSLSSGAGFDGLRLGSGLFWSIMDGLRSVQRLQTVFRHVLSRRLTLCPAELSVHLAMSVE